jgi:hypothetical protein
MKKNKVFNVKKPLNYLLFNNFATANASAIKKRNNGTTNAKRCVRDKTSKEKTEA